MDQRVRDAIPTGQTTRTDLAVDPDAVWVLNRQLPGQDLPVRVDPATDRVVASAELRSDRPADLQTGLVAADSTVVAARGRASLYLLDPATTRAQAPVPLPGTGALGVGAVWVTDNARGRLLRADRNPEPASGVRQASTPQRAPGPDEPSRPHGREVRRVTTVAGERGAFLGEK